MNKRPTKRALRLILSAEPATAKVWEFIGPRAVVIGRDQKAEVNIADNSISGYHAVIELGKNKAIVRDLGSLNGTWLNSHLVGRRPFGRGRQGGPPVSGQGVSLSDGDIVAVGGMVFRVSLLDAAEDAATSLAMIKVNTRCPGCGKEHAQQFSSKYADNLCTKCRGNPVAALKLLQAGMARRIKNLASLKGLKIAKTLGRGATSAVFLAVRKENGAQLALKVMPPAVSDNDWARKSFLREAAIGRALKHNNVTRLYDFGFYGGAYFFLMEYCQGGTCEEYRVAQNGMLDPVQALRIMLPVFDGLDYLHNVRLTPVGLEEEEDMPEIVGLVHRDLKPANIFLGGASGQIPKIADIGVGKFFGQGGSCHTRTGTVAGSPATMPRQQAINFKYVGPEVDIWAAAASFYKLVAGDYPRDFTLNKDPWQVVLKEAPRPLQSLVPNFPDNLASIIDEALIDNPDIIYHSAKSLKKALVQAARLDSLTGFEPQEEEEEFDE